MTVSLGDYTYTTDAAGHATITGFRRDYAGPLTIPDRMGGCPVVSIDWRAFVGCEGLTRIRIPGSVTNLAPKAFVGTGVTEFLVDADNAYYASVGGVLFDKSRTTLLSFPNGKTGNYAIPASVTTIGASAFWGCHGLIEIAIPANATRIEPAVVCEFPGVRTRINATTFVGCSSLTSIMVDPANSSCRSVDGVLFNKDQTELVRYPCGRAGPYNVPVGVDVIGYRAFDGCTGLTGVTLPDSIKDIGREAFQNCSRLPRVTIPPGVVSIGSLAFSGCEGLTNVFLLARGASIGKDAFGGCTRLPMSCRRLGVDSESGPVRLTVEAYERTRNDRPMPGPASATLGRGNGAAQSNAPSVFPPLPPLP